MDADCDNPWARRVVGDATRARDFHPSTPRGAVRHAALSLLAAGGRAIGRERAVAPLPRVQILLLHHLFDDEAENFRRLLRALAERYTFVSYSEAAGAAQQGGATQPLLAFSFDDGRRSCLAAARILAEHGAKAAFFICPSIVGERDPAAIRRFSLDRLHYPSTPFLDWSECEELLRLGHEIGNHTVNHVNLGRVSPEEARSEIESARAAILSRLGTCEHFAWPYGGLVNFSGAAATAARDCGHRSLASAVRGCHLAGGPGAGGHGNFTPAFLCRDHVIAAWPVNHTLYFLARNARAARADAGAWPQCWGPPPKGAAPCGS